MMKIYEWQIIRDILKQYIVCFAVDLEELYNDKIILYTLHDFANKDDILKQYKNSNIDYEFQIKIVDNIDKFVKIDY